jgi:chemotaxis protein histidine kinase CheA
LTDIAFYAPTFREADSEAYRKAIDANADRQKAMLQEGTAAVCTKTWTVGGDAKAGERMVKAITKLALRAFNGESDATIARVTWKNRDTMVKRIEKSHESINDLVSTWNIEISKMFLALKLEELQLTYEQEEMRQHERDEQRALKEQMREEAKAREEAERAKQDAERQERQAEMALAKARIELAKVREAERAEYELRVAQLEAKLTEAHQLSQRATSLAQLTKRGYVYIISNIGSFGEGMFKIGMTRRWDPQERVDELGDASVPFEFDVHALIWSEDAPRLEAELHKHFSAQRVNLINLRKEFFRVSIAEIQDFCQDNKITAQLTLLAEAKEFRQSEAMRRTAATHTQEVSGVTI